jgi:hypothetical protein
MFKSRLQEKAIFNLLAAKACACHHLVNRQVVVLISPRLLPAVAMRESFECG